MGFLITCGIIIGMLVLNNFCPVIFSKIFAFLFKNNNVCIVILIFAIIGFIVISSMIWRQLTGGISSFNSKGK